MFRIFAAMLLTGFVIAPASAGDKCFNLDLSGKNGATIHLINNCDDEINYKYCIRFNSDNGGMNLNGNGKLKIRESKDENLGIESLAGVQKFKTTLCVGGECIPDAPDCK